MEPPSLVIDIQVKNVLIAFSNHALLCSVQDIANFSTFSFIGYQYNLRDV